MKKSVKIEMIIAGVPHSDHPDGHPEFPHAFLRDCPICNDKMWWTLNKSAEERENTGAKPACFHCIEKMFEKNFSKVRRK